MSRRVAESLADRGRPAMWANEMQAAELSGVSRRVFRAKVAAWEKRGFPQKNPENGKRSIPAILAFWRLPSNDHGTSAANERGNEESLENW